MFTIPQIRIKNSLTSNEMVILKSIALGLGCDTIIKLLELSERNYQSICQSIYTKLGVGNSFAAVQLAFKNGLLQEKEYTSEKIKGLALEFATKNIDRLKPLVESDPKKSLWEFYDLLLDFITRMKAAYKYDSYTVEK